MLKRVLSILVFTTAISSVPAFANSQKIENTTETTTMISLEESRAGFTVPGQLTVDDYATDKDNKAFYTVHSKNGNEFYIIVDGKNSENNVYFLNAVDESDLIAIANDSDPNSVLTIVTTEETTTESTTEATTEEEIPSKKNSEGSLAPVIFIAIFAAVVAILIKKKKAKSSEDEDEDEENFDETKESEETNEVTNTKENDESNFKSSGYKHPIEQNDESNFSNKGNNFDSFEDDNDI